MKTLDELWYGNISPFEQCTRGDKRLKELLKLVARTREELDDTLTEKQKETLEKFEECMNEMHSITERDALSYGFRLGVQLMAESSFCRWERMKIYRVGPKVPPYKLHKSGLGPWGPPHFSLSPLKKRVSVIKEKGSHRKSGL